MTRTRVLDLVPVVRRERAFRQLLIARAGSALGSYVAVVALTIDILARTGSATWVSFMLLGDYLPAFALGFFLGPLIDRWSRKRLMVGSDLVNLGVFSLLALAGAPWQIVGLATVAGMATGFFTPSVYASVPNLVTEHDLPRAMSLVQAVETLAMIGGPIAGGLLIAAGGPHLAYVFNAATYLFSAFLIGRIPAARLQRVRAESRGHKRDLAEGFALVRRERALLTVLFAWSLCIFSFAVLNVGTAVMATKVFASGGTGLGLMISAGGVGLLVGGLAAPRLLERSGPRLYPTAIATCALSLGLAVLSPTVWVALPFLLGVGMGNGAALVCNALFIQRGAPDQLRGRAVAILMGVGNSAGVLGYVVSGLVISAVGARLAWLATAVVLAAAALVAGALIPTTEVAGAGISGG